MWSANHTERSADMISHIRCNCLELSSICRPPRNDVKGVGIAVGLIAAWCLLFYHGCWQIKLTGSNPSWWIDIIGTFLLLEFVNTGLFITTHDAMHGTICYRCAAVHMLLLMAWVQCVHASMYSAVSSSCISSSGLQRCKTPTINRLVGM
eukprot:GHUV01033268.1.p2 GENE.GHUV01033268.1~~GHUV01033268.1.p2  ORF type:complete len:150 (-),score=36.79 GHUV01033268.1:95-544(-)